jgi:hypothetical protein
MSHIPTILSPNGFQNLVYPVAYGKRMHLTLTIRKHKNSLDSKDNYDSSLSGSSR